MLSRSSLALGIGGVLLFVGGGMHPPPDVTRSFDDATAGMMADPRWVPGHALLLIGYLLLIPGLIGHGRAAAPATRLASWFAVAGAALSVVEMSFHLAAVVDLGALRAGGATPILNTHLVLATLAQPLLGGSIV